MNAQFDGKDAYGGATVASGITGGVIIAATNVLGYKSKCITVYNQGAVTLSGVIVQINPEPGAAPSVNDVKWETIATTGTIASATAVTIQSTAMSKWIQVKAINDRSQSIVASGYLYAVPR